MYSKECKEFYYKRLPKEIKEELSNYLSCTTLRVITETYEKLIEYRNLGLIEYRVLAGERVFDLKHFYRKEKELIKHYDEIKPFLHTDERDSDLNLIPVKFSIPHPNEILANMEDGILPNDKHDAIDITELLTGKTQLANRSKKYRENEKSDKKLQVLRRKHNLIYPKKENPIKCIYEIKDPNFKLPTKK